VCAQHLQYIKVRSEAGLEALVSQNHIEKYKSEESYERRFCLGRCGEDVERRRMNALHSIRLLRGVQIHRPLQYSINPVLTEPRIWVAQLSCSALLLDEGKAIRVVLSLTVD